MKLNNQLVNIEPSGKATAEPPDTPNTEIR